RPQRTTRNPTVRQPPPSHQVTTVQLTGADFISQPPLPSADSALSVVSPTAWEAARRPNGSVTPLSTVPTLVARCADNLYSASYVREADKNSATGSPAGGEPRLPVPARAPALPGAAGQRTRRPRAVRAGLRDPERVRDQARALHLRACSHLAGHEADDAHVRPQPRGGRAG